MKLHERLKEAESSIKAREVLKTLDIDIPNGHRRMTEGLEFGNYHISIQASIDHYSSPRITTEYSNYTSMELAVFDKESGSEFVNVSTHEQLKNFDRLDELQESWNHVVYGFVDVDVLQDFVEFVEELTNE